MLASSVLFLGACNDEDVEPEYIGNWYQTGLPDFEGITRRSAVGFTIGELGYAGLGYSANQERLKDFWEYNPVQKFWTQKAAFGGTARQDAVAFSIGNKGYVGTGYDGDYKSDFWEYDPASNKWKQVDSLPSTSGSGARQQAVAFTLGNKAYVGLGFDGNYKQDFYEYTPDDKGGNWKQITSFIGGKRQGAAAFVIGDKAYVGFGRGNTAVNHSDLYEFNPGAEQVWVAKAELTDHPRTNPLAVSLNNKGYIIGGIQASSLKDVWEYDPVGDAWTQKTSFEGGQRSYAIGFSLKNVIYYGTGTSGSFLDDFWGFDPSATQVDDD
ncbi:Kelch repeat-containing protein [Ravibacter arvi]